MLSSTVTLPCVLTRAAAASAAPQVPLTWRAQVHRHDRVEVRAQELELAPEVARRRLRGLRVLRVACDLDEELLGA